MIYFLRHCERKKGYFYNEELNILDDPLSEKGLADAARIAGYFKDIKISRIIASRYKRTYQTALPVSRLKGIPIETDGRVNEINNGDLRYMEADEIAAEFPDFWREFTEHKKDMRFPGGESGADVLKRQNSFLDDMKKETGDILVVSHDGFIRELICNILGAPTWHRYRLKTSYGALTVIDYIENEWWVLRFNQNI